MDKKLKTYRVIPGESEMYCISVVESPAVESDFVALSKQQKNIQFKAHEEGEKRMLYGIALRCDYPIYRCYGGEEFYITFDKDCIRRLSQKYMKNYGQKNWNLEHGYSPAEGLTITESWLVDNVEFDKSKHLGLSGVTEGSWCIGVSVDDNEIWEQVKEGTYKGFSIEAYCSFEEIEQHIIENNKINNNTEMNKKTEKVETVLAKIKNILMGALNEEDVEAVVEEVTNQVEEQTETTEEAIDQLETVVEEIENTVEETEGEPAETEMAEEIPAEEIAEEVVSTVEDANDTEEGAAEDLQAIVDGLREEIDTLKAENEELKKQNQKMSKQPSTKVVKQNKQDKIGGVKGAFSVLKAQGFIS